MCALLVEMSCEKLCELEAQVNMAVLRLCMLIFSEHPSPVKKFNECHFFTSESGEAMKSDVTLEQWDLYVDRLIQIGLYTVASSTNSSRKFK